MGTYEHAYNYAYLLGSYAPASEYASWYLGEFGECEHVLVEDCDHPSHAVAFPRFFALYEANAIKWNPLQGAWVDAIPA